ncbi:MAG TPA: FHA domain-containing protein [Acidimicrobiales bacterium]|nr:FHA domain-containing protein [Acidimicrobiales bacterium]
MTHGILDVLRYFLLALIWLFLLYAARMVYVEVRRGQRERAAREGRPPETGRGLPRRTPHVRILESSDRRGERFALGGETTIGRANTCTISLAGDNFVSALHARIVEHEGSWWLEDLGSTNGTFHNARRIGGPEQLRRGDRFTVGSTVFEVAR